MSEPGEVAALAAAAEQAHRDGDQARASELHRRILALDEQSYTSLEYLGLIAFQAGRLAESLDYLGRAVDVRADSAVARRNLGMALAQSGRLDEALARFKEAIRLDPQDALNYLYAGSIYEALRRPEPAACAYSLALELQPAYRHLQSKENAPQHLRQFSARALQLAGQRERRIFDQILESWRRRYGRDDTARFARMIDIKLGREPAQFVHRLQQPFETYFPGLPPIAWFEPEEFEWARRFEDGYADLAAELTQLGAERDDLQPYVQHDPGDEGLRRLLRSLDWSSLHLYTAGQKNEAVCARYPRTVALLEQSPLLRCAGRSPEAFFSILKPHTHISAHHGQTNYKLTVHLPIVIPDGCAIKVGDETRRWQPGELLIFDDSFLHEAWNESDETRIVLLFNVWNPHLSQLEREGIEALFAALQQWCDTRRAQTLGEQ